MVILSYGTHIEHPAITASQRAYADRLGAAFEFIPVEHGHEALGAAYQRASQLPAATPVLLLEWDIDVTPDAPNIFDLLDSPGLRMRPHPDLLRARQGFFNLGVQLGYAADFAQALPFLPIFHGGDTNLWEFRYHMAVQGKGGIKILPLPIEFNAIGHDGHFIHRSEQW